MGSEDLSLVFTLGLCYLLLQLLVGHAHGLLLSGQAHVSLVVLPRVLCPLLHLPPLFFLHLLLFFRQHLLMERQLSWSHLEEVERQASCSQHGEDEKKEFPVHRLCDHRRSEVDSHVSSALCNVPQLLEVLLVLFIFFVSQSTEQVSHELGVKVLHRVTYFAYSANWLGSLAYLVRSERPGSSFFLPKGPKKCLLGMLQSYEYLEV